MLRSSWPIDFLRSRNRAMGGRAGQGGRGQHHPLLLPNLLPHGRTERPFGV
jgi:hypothetical protein